MKRTRIIAFLLTLVMMTGILPGAVADVATPSDLDSVSLVFDSIEEQPAEAEQPEEAGQSAEAEQPEEAELPAVSSLKVTTPVAAGTSFTVTAKAAAAEKALLLVDGKPWPEIDTTDMTDDERAEALLRAAANVSDSAVKLTAAAPAVGEHTVSLRLYHNGAWTASMGSAKLVVEDAAPVEETEADVPAEEGEPTAETTSGEAETQVENPAEEPEIEEGTPAEEPETEEEAPLEISIQSDGQVSGNTIYLSVGERFEIETNLRISSISYFSCYLEPGFTSATSYVLTAKTAGTTEIDLEFANGLEMTYKVVITANRVTPSSISFPVSKATLYLGHTYNSGLTVYPSSAAASVTYRSSNTYVATVNASTGLITPQHKGTATITATTTNGLKAVLTVTVANEGDVDTLSLSQGRSITVYLYQTPTKLQPVYTPAAAKPTFTWKSSNTSVVSVSADGTLTPYKEGTATITCTAAANKRSVTCTVKVVDPYKPTSVSLRDGKSIQISTGTTWTLAPILAPSTARATYTWKSSNTKVVTVSSSGVLTPIKEGTATITCTTHNGKSVTCSVRVVDPYKPTGVTLREGQSIQLGMGTTKTLTPVLSPSTARATYTWKSSNTKVVTVSASGVLTPIKEGTATITCTTHNGKYVTCSVKVVDPRQPSAITVNYDGGKLASGTVTWPTCYSLRLGYSAVAAGGSGYTVPSSYLTWGSSSTTIAAIDQYGYVTIRKPGTVTFTLKGTNGVKGTITMKFVDAAPLRSISMSPSTLSVTTGKTAQAKAVLNPSNASPLVDLRWTSSNTAVATVNQSGVVTGIRAGTATIYCTDAKTGIKGACYVVVSNAPVYRAVVAVEATSRTLKFNGVSCTGLSQRQSDYDGMLAMLGRQSYNGVKWQVNGMHNTSASSVLKALENVSKVATSNDVTLFFFLGHGSTSGSIHFYDGSYISSATLKRYLDAIPGKVVVMLGACYSGTYIARGESADANAFNSSIISTFSKGEQIPVTYSENGQVIEVTPEMFNADDPEYTPRRGELLQSKYYVLTTCSADENGYSIVDYSSYSTSKRTFVAKESTSYNYFTRGVCRAGGRDSVTGSITWSSGTRTLQQVYTEVKKYCTLSTVQVYPSNSSFILFQH